MENKALRILLYLGKFPGYGFDVDGGSILAKQLIDSLKDYTKLDVVFIRKNKEEYHDEFVNSVRYVEYKYARENKFFRRLNNLDTNREAIGDFTQYDCIITAHVSKFFGLEDLGNDFWEKTILFPMFCTSSYKKAGENVPEEYTMHENYVINKVKTIITPSHAEKQNLIEDYKCNEEKIYVVNRGINPLFEPKKQDMSDNIKQIIYVGSIKPQKNTIEALNLIKILNKSDEKYHLNLVGTVQDHNLMKECKKFIVQNKLEKFVSVYNELSQEQLAKLFQKMDINISVSNWETFGRGIFEGIQSGLPTFVPSRLTVVKNICDNNPGVMFSENVEEMSRQIQETCQNNDIYCYKKQCLPLIAEQVSYVSERKILTDIILNSCQ